MNGMILGQVVNVAGGPVFGATVAVSAGPPLHSDIAALTNNEGRFRLGNLTPGTYTITVLSAGKPPINVQVDVVDGQQASVEIRVGDEELDTDESALKVTLVPDSINWNLVRLVRVLLEYEGNNGDVTETREIFFSPTSHDRIEWTVKREDKDGDRYIYTIVYFMTHGIQKTVGPKESSDRELILDPERSSE